MYRYEQALWTEGKRLVCGVDEAGRGPLAGPVTAAAVILNPDDLIDGLNDSKKLSEKKREALFEPICRRSLAWGIGWASPEEIDTVNILNATFLAMQRAVKQLSLTPDVVLVDGNRDPSLTLETRCIIGGDGKSASIAAASILAKVSRDRLMRELAIQYPQYGLDVHKGYPTKAHRSAVLQWGPSPIHRKSFLKKLLHEARQ